MTSPPPPAPSEGRSAVSFLRPLRDLAAWALVAAPAVLLFVAVVRLIPGGVGEQFASRTQDSFYSFVNVPTVFFPLGAVLLALLVLPQHPRAKLITMIAAIEYAVAGFFGIIFGLLIGLVQVAGFSVRSAFEELLVRLAWLAVFAVAAYATYQLWRNLFHTPKAKPQQGMYGQPQYGAPGAYPGQPGYGPPPQGAPAGWNQPGQPGQPVYGQPQPGQPQPGQPVYGQPAQQQPQPVWGPPDQGHAAAPPPPWGQSDPGHAAPPPPWGQSDPATPPPWGQTDHGHAAPPQPAWGQPPVSAQPASAQPYAPQQAPVSAQPYPAQQAHPYAAPQAPVSAQPASAAPGTPPGPYAPEPGYAPGPYSSAPQSFGSGGVPSAPAYPHAGAHPAPRPGEYGAFSEPTQAVPRHNPQPAEDRTELFGDDRPGYGPADQDPPRH